MKKLCLCLDGDLPFCHQRSKWLGPKHALKIWPILLAKTATTRLSITPNIIILYYFTFIPIENAKTKTINEPPVQYSKLSTGKSKGSLDLSTEKELKVTKNGFSVFPALVKTFGASFFLGAFMQITVAG